MDVIDFLEKYDMASAIIFLVLCFAAIKEVWDNIICWILEKLNLYHRKKSDKEDEKEILNNRIAKLEEHDNWQYNQLLEITNTLKEIRDDMKKNEDYQKQCTVASYRSTIYSLHKDFTEKGYLTQIEYETFKELSDIYIECNGNHTCKDKLIPEVLDLPIKD